MKYVEVETMTQSNVPNINNVVYSSETINKMIDEYKDRSIKLCFDNAFTKTPIEYNFHIVDPASIIGEVTKIYDGKIECMIYDKYESLFDELLVEGYRPGMRYTGKVSKHNDDEIKEVTDIKLISYDMIKKEVNKQ